MLTERDSVTDTVRGLEGGADDYMAKLFRFAELEARIRLRLRAGVDQAEPTVLAQGRIRLDLRTRQATIDAVTVELSAREFTLAELFLRNPGQVLSREQLLSHVWGYDFEPGSQCGRRLRRVLAQEARGGLDSDRPRLSAARQRVTS